MSARATIGRFCTPEEASCLPSTIQAPGFRFSGIFGAGSFACLRRTRSGDADQISTCFPSLRSTRIVFPRIGPETSAP